MKKLLILILTIWTFILLPVTAYAQKQYNVSAWLPSWDVEEAFQSFKYNSDVINTISPFWYHVNEDGTLSPTNNSEDQAIIKFAKDNGVTIIPTISNSFDGEKVSSHFNDPEMKKQAIQNIIDKVNEFDYDGIDIDYEGLNTEDIDVFTYFIRDLREELDRYDKKLTIAIQAKSFSSLLTFGNRGQDWKALSQYVDEFRIMTYDYGWSGSIPRAVAPEFWVEAVILYAVTQVPKEKIYVGIPFYGYGWSDDYFTSYTYDTIELIIEKYGVDFQYVPEQKVNRLFYISDFDEREVKVPHEVWFENRASIEPKLELVKKYDLGGIAIWRLGKEDEENWRKIRNVLKNEGLGEKLYFSDVDQNSTYYNEITKLADLGIVRGQGDTQEYKPDQTLNRAEVLKMALNSFANDTSKYWFEETRPEDFENPFSDVSETQWFFPYIQTGVDMDIVQGYSNGSFMPGNDVVRVEAIKIVLESSGISVRGSAVGERWYEPYKEWVVEKGIYKSNGFVAEEPISRGEAAFIIVEVLKIFE